MRVCGALGILGVVNFSFFWHFSDFLIFFLIFQPGNILKAKCENSDRGSEVWGVSQMEIYTILDKEMGVLNDHEYFYGWEKASKGIF